MGQPMSIMSSEALRGEYDRPVQDLRKLLPLQLDYLPRTRYFIYRVTLLGNDSCAWNVGEELLWALSNCTVQSVHSSFVIRNDARVGITPTQENEALRKQPNTTYRTSVIFSIIFYFNECSEQLPGYELD
jgi:hypothetical protein